MENSFQTSFIPKKPVITSGGGSGRKINVYMVGSIIILSIMAFYSLGLFLYKSYLSNKKEEASSLLLQMHDNFNKDTISGLELYNKRAVIAKQILSNHVVLSPLFKLINEITLSSIQYTKFSHETANNVFSVKMSGIAHDYKSIALQADVFNTSKGRMFKDVVFSNLIKTPNNSITFDVNFNVDPELLSYTNYIVNEQAVINENSDQTDINNGVPNVQDSTNTNITDLNQQLQTTNNTQ